MARKDYLNKTAIRTNNPDNWQIFREARNSLNKLNKILKNEYFKKRLNINKNKANNIKINGNSNNITETQINSNENEINNNKNYKIFKKSI